MLFVEGIDVSTVAESDTAMLGIVCSGAILNVKDIQFTADRIYFCT